MIPWHSLDTVGKLLQDGELDALELEDESLKIRMRSRPEAAAAPPRAAPAPGGGGEAATSGEAPPEDWVSIDAPMVGTFYEAPAPDADPFVQVGDSVGYDTTVCIIEAMKLMNEIEAECEGVIREVCVKNAEPVSKGDVLFYVEPD